MDLKQIEYILKIAEENNITRAAEKLFITQSALNQQLLKLEKELGTPLFHRSRTNWRLTKAGEVYIQNAKEIMRIKKNTYDQIQDIAEVQKGTLSIGFTPGRGISMFPAVYPQFHREFPDITIVPLERRVRELQAMIADDQIDIAFLTLNESDRTKDNYIDLFDEEIYLIVPKIHPLSAFAAPEGEPYAVMDLCKFQHEPFVLMDKNSTMRSLINRIFEEANFEPNILFETRDNITILNMIRCNICCSLIPAHYVRREHDNMTVFALPSHPTWQIVASYKKNGYLSKAAQYFIELAREFWAM